MKIQRRFNQVERKDIVEKSRQCLWGETGSPGLDYLLSQRQLSEMTIRSFGLGYIPAYVKHQLAGRIIFPVYDASGNLIVISSRHVDGDDHLPTYWHESYEKSFYLYGMSNAIPMIRKWRFATIVEGQFDVLQLHSNTIENAVGLCGSKLSDVQLATICRYCEEIVLVLDKDKNLAGQKATDKALDLSQRYLSGLGNVFSVTPPRYSSNRSAEHRFKCSFVKFQEDTDPDEFVRKYGGPALLSLLKEKVVEMRYSHDRQYN